MARLNVKPKLPQVYTHEGGAAIAGLKPIEQLKRSVLACLLWENEFYEDGQSIADRIKSVAEKCDPREVAALAVTARSVHNLRHVPLLLLEVLSRTGAGQPGLVSGAVSQVIQRADELSEFVALYMGGGRKPLSGQVKKGLAAAFQKFDEYQLAKYDREGKFRLRDVLFLCHAKPVGSEQKALWQRLINGELKVPDTWEVALSGGADKKETFTRLLSESKLGYLALLRNLRGMEQAGVEDKLIISALLARKGAQRVLPFRYVAAARAAPRYEGAIDKALVSAIEELPALKGRTGVLVDVSGSMDTGLSGKSDMKRIDAAAALASVLNCEDLIVGTFSNGLVIVPPRRGMAGVDAVIRSQPHGGTMLAASMTAFESRYKLDRLIVVTDEQSHDGAARPKADKAYMINVASARNGVGYGNGWTHIDGFSEGVLRYIHECESEWKIAADVPLPPGTGRVSRAVAHRSAKPQTVTEKTQPASKAKKTRSTASSKRKSRSKR